MAIAHVNGNHAGGSTATATVAVTLGATVSSGDAVVGMVSWGTNNPADLTSVTDDKGNSYTILDSAEDNPNAQASASFILGNITNSPQTITAHFASSVSFRTILVDEYSGVTATTNPNDGHTGQFQSGIGTATDAVKSGNITTTKNGDLIWGATYNTATGDSQNPGTGFAQRQQDIVNAIATTEDKGQTTAGLVAATFTDVGSGGSNYTTFVIALAPIATNLKLNAKQLIFV